MNLDNCPRCGKLFAKGIREVCTVCTRDIDKEYELCANYLREYKGAIITELSDETGVSIKQITKFIREGRISMVNAPNMSYPCESCGTLIREGHLCDNCRNRLTNAAQEMKGNLAKKEELKGSSSTQTAYRGIDRYKDR
ncbi:TIGR03826 family flagellar region protein [Paenibacillus harenae]|uniref:Flagellar operon protein (TIGR03826 family) n=1 Tax=Paenibacillus harenae TaxID=306543 RepID=A0ABT9UDQ2_PAEHA|nr:TIGR03826 family flagellar region protein [Paenibacillus harenae]MDQ0116549.1 flagellar operon protein (TIGR03826 family) [Paenibacillus harenae]